MNKNLPHAERIVRAGLTAEGDVARTITHALNAAGLLVDPEKTYSASAVVPLPPARTALEEQALAWDAACARARALADHLRALFAAELHGVQTVLADRARVRLTMAVTRPGQWAAMVRYFSITEEADQLDYAYVGHGHRDGVGVTVVAYDAPEVDARTIAAAARPHRFGGVVYDLALPHRDINGDVWTLHTVRAEDDVPLLVRAGSAEAFPLPTLVEYVGPLVPAPQETAGGAAA
ncbi:BN159_2729 family protein [Streptomyces filamentosus]|uniref:BN159_2729 family protein n=1 Tax=Streptomyces filamentosus TaxID=67294 RepID=UPI0037D81942